MNNERPRIAVICTEYRPLSHADVIVSRWLEPFPTDHLYGWTQPASQIVSIYAEQRHNQKDLIPASVARHGLQCFPSIEKALTLGGDSLAVDGILLIAEHGDYPENELGQKLYPRKEFFDAIMAVFEAAGRSVPIFFDKHLSWNPEWIREMSDRVAKSRIPFFAGSSIPFSLPESLTDLPRGSKFDEVVAIYYTGLESYLFHSAELVESVIAGRFSEQEGISEIVAWKDEEVWQAVDRGDFSWELVEAACASASPEALEAIQRLRRDRDGGPVYAFRLRYDDGFYVTHFMQTDVVKHWCLAARLDGGQNIAAGSPDVGGAAHFFPHFARLCVKIDEFFISGRSPIPTDRIYRTSMTTALCLRALQAPGRRLSTPELSL